VIGPADEGAREAAAEGFADAVTFAFGDAEHGLYGVGRLGVAGGRASALAVAFAGRVPLGAIADGDLELTGADWADRSAGGLRTTVDQPLERWTVAWEAESCGYDLVFTAISAPVDLDGGGMTGYLQLCRVTGSVRGPNGLIAVDGLGERRHEWGVADWKDLELVRTVSVWFGEEHGGVSVSSLRPAGAHGHDEELVAGTLVDAGDPVEIDDPRLSSTYDADGHQRRAGLELWVGEEDAYPHRLAGEVICGSSLDLGALRLDLAFMHWHGEGARGFGRYDVLRRA
jgi:hypothetical protein